MINEEERLDELEARIDDLSREIEEIKIKGDQNSEIPATTNKSRPRNELFMGSMLIVVGLYFLGKSLDWYSLDIPFWPAILILFGLGAIINSRK